MKISKFSYVVTSLAFVWFNSVGFSHDDFVNWTYAENDPDSVTTEGYVGIGTYYPDYELDVLGDINFTGSLYFNGVAVNLDPSPITQSGDDSVFLNGNVGIGTSTPTNKLDVSGNIGSTGSGSFAGSLSAATAGFAGNIDSTSPTTGAITAHSAGFADDVFIGDDLTVTDVFSTDNQMHIRNTYSQGELKLEQHSGSNGAHLRISRHTANPFFRFNFENNTNGVGVANFGADSGNFWASNNPVNVVAIEPTYNQTSGNHALTDLLINRTETAIGNGPQRLIDAQVGGASKFSVDNKGKIRGAELSLTTPAQSGTREYLQRHYVSDQATTEVGFVNGTSGNGNFAPTVYGFNSDDNTVGISLTGIIQEAHDSGPNDPPVIRFNAFAATDINDPMNSLTSVDVRPLFGWGTTSGTIHMQMAASGALDLYSSVGSTSPTTGALTVVGGAGVGGDLNVGGDLSASNLSGTNTGDQTITLSGDVTGSGTDSFVATIDAAIARDSEVAAAVSAQAAITQTLVDSKQPLHPNLTTISNTATPAGLALLDDVDAASQRLTLGLAPSDTVSFANIGIGTTSPSAKLHVHGGARITGFGHGTIGGSNLSNGWLKIGNNLAMDNNEIYFGGIDGHIGVLPGNDLIFHSGGASRIHLDSGGNVGIGTSTPTEKLDVIGDIKFGGASEPNWGYGFLNMESGWNGGNYATLGSTGGSQGSLAMIHNPHIPFRSDNVASSHPYTGKAAIRAATDVAASRWWQFGLAGDYFHIFRNDTVGGGFAEFFRIDNQGRVGIGTTSPTEALEVVGNASFSGDISAGSLFVAGDPVVVSSDLSAYVPISGSNQITGGAAGLTFSAGGTDQNISLVPSGSGFTEIVGHVSINKAVPQGELDIDGDLWVTNTAGGGAEDNGLRIRADVNSGSEYGFTSQHSNTVALVNEQGTTNQALLIGDTDSSSDDMLFGVSVAEGANNPSTGTESWLPRFTVTGKGEVGVGTSNPSAQLHLSDTPYVAGAGPTFKMSNAHGDAFTITAYANNTPGGWDGMALGGSVYALMKPVSGWPGVIGTDSDSRLIFATNSTQKMIILSSGEVGIGTSTPTETLEVAGTMKVSGATRFDGPVRIAPQGDLGMGTFIAEPN
ncbi:MAG: hypothetical protein SynsKO_21630 [Synoicihabitans sp.]